MPDSRRPLVPEIQQVVTWIQDGRWDEAERCCHQLLAGHRETATAYHLLGLICFNTHRPSEAFEWLKKAAAEDSKNAEIWNHFGIVAHQIGETSTAIDAFRQAVDVLPTFIEAHHNLGNALKDARRLEEAWQVFQRAIAIAPAQAELYHNLAGVLYDQGQFDASEAQLRLALERNPQLFESHLLLGHLAHRRSDRLSAIHHYRQAIDLRPESAVAWNDLGNLYQESGDFNAAIRSFENAIRLAPNSAIAYRNLGNTYQLMSNPEQAARAYEKALEIAPDGDRSMLVHQYQYLCQWDRLESLAKEVIQAVDEDRLTNVDQVTMPFCFVSLPVPTTASQQLHCARRYAQRFEMADGTSKFRAPHATTPKAATRIRVGYLSADYRAHAMAYHLAEWFEAQNRDEFELFGYSLGPDDGSPIRGRLIRAFDHFTDLRCEPTEVAAERIRKDAIDILVDLQGYTALARTDLLALRPAPLQVSYLGFPGTSGAEFMDYLFVDDYLVRAGEERFYSEKLVFLPGCYQVNDSQLEISSTPTRRSAWDLPEDQFVFCSFNSALKYTPAMFDIWMSLLSELPSSVLWLPKPQPVAEANLIREATNRGVAPQRLRFTPRCSLSEHLARHRLADLTLDTFPYTGHATASLSLRAGVPIVTQVGSSLVSRVSASLMRQVGMEDWIATSHAHYRELALRLALDPSRLQAVREKLNEGLQSTDLFDGRAFARKTEWAYREMVKLYRAGRSPQSLRVPPLDKTAPGLA